MVPISEFVVIVYLHSIDWRVLKVYHDNDC